MASGPGDATDVAPSFADALFASPHEIVVAQARGGTKATKGVAQFLMDWAAAEEGYGEALVKVAKRHLSRQLVIGSSPGLTAAWGTFLQAQHSRGKQHVGFGICVRSSIASLGLQFLQNDSRNIDQLASQGSGLLGQLVRARTTHEKCRRQYQEACAAADALLDTGPEPPGGANGAAEAKTQETAPRGENAAAEANAVAGAGAAATELATAQPEETDSILTKVWGTLTPVTASSQERRDDAVRAVAVSRQRYCEAVEALNHANAFVRAALESNLNAFEHRERSRAELQVKMLRRLFLAEEGLVEKLTDLADAMREQVDAVDLAQEMAAQRRQADHALEEVRTAMERMREVREALASPRPAAQAPASERAELDPLVQSTLQLLKDRCDAGHMTLRSIRRLQSFFGDVLKAEEAYASTMLRVAERHARGTGNESLAKGLQGEGASVARAAREALGVLGQIQASSMETARAQERGVVGKLTDVAREVESGQKELWHRFDVLQRQVQQKLQLAQKARAKLQKVTKDLKETEQALQAAEAEVGPSGEDVGAEATGDVLSQWGLRETAEQRVPRLRQKINGLWGEQGTAEDELGRTGADLRSEEASLLEVSTRLFDAFSSLESLRIANLHQVFQGFQWGLKAHLRRVAESMEGAQELLGAADQAADIAEFLHEHGEPKPPTDDEEPLIFGSAKTRALADAEARRDVAPRRTSASAPNIWDQFGQRRESLRLSETGIEEGEVRDASTVLSPPNGPNGNASKTLSTDKPAMRSAVPVGVVLDALEVSDLGLASPSSVEMDALASGTLSPPPFNPDASPAPFSAESGMPISPTGSAASTQMPLLHLSLPPGPGDLSVACTRIEARRCRSLPDSGADSSAVEDSPRRNRRRRRILTPQPRARSATPSLSLGDAMVSGEHGATFSDSDSTGDGSERAPDSGQLPLSEETRRSLQTGPVDGAPGRATGASASAKREGLEIAKSPPPKPPASPVLTPEPLRALTVLREGEERFRHFNLPGEEKIIESFVCALYRNNLPMQGRLFLTARFLCFAGWRETQVIVRLRDVVSVERMNTVIVVPNALGVRVKAGDMLFFASFLDRDGCHRALTQLVDINRNLVDILEQGTPAVRHSGEAKRHAVSGSRDPYDEDEEDAQPPSIVPDLQRMATSFRNDGNSSEFRAMLAGLPAPPGDDAHLRPNLDMAVDDVVPLGVAAFQKMFWGPEGDGAAFFGGFLDRVGDTLLDGGDWKPSDFVHPITGETFELERKLFYDHPRTSMMFIGPPTVPTHQIQRLRHEGTNPRHDRLILETETWFEKIPYNDYFSVECRWVATRKATTDATAEASLRIQIGVGVLFKKSTFLASQIRSGTLQELKELYQNWLAAAQETVEAGPSPSPLRDASGVPAALVDKASPSASQRGRPAAKVKSLARVESASPARDERILSCLRDEHLVYVLAGLLAFVLYLLVGRNMDVRRVEQLLEKQQRVQEAIMEELRRMRP